MCHLGAIPTFRSSGRKRKRKMASSDCEVISFDSALKEAPKCLSEFNRSHALKSEQKEAISALVSGNDLLAVLPTGFWKAWYFRSWFLWKKLWRGTFERNCRLSYLTYCLWSTGISIFDRIKGSLRSRIVIWRMQSAANIKSYLRQKRTFWWNHFFIYKKRKKTATRFHQSMQVCIKQNMAGKPSSAVVCSFKVSFTIKWEKNCQIDKRQLYSRIFAKKLWVQQISAHICDCEGGFVEAIFFSGWKKTASPFHSSALRVFVFVGRLCFRFLI